MKKIYFISTLIAILCTANVQAQAVYEKLVLADAFANEQAAQADVIQNSGTGTLYIKNQSAGQRETFFRISLDDMDNLTAQEVDYAKVELRYYSFRTGQTANTNAISVYPVADNTWDETTLTWTNSRTLSTNAISAGAIATAAGVRIAGYSGSGQQGTAGATDAYNAANITKIDISSYAIQQYKLGIKTISIMLHVTNENGNGDQQIAHHELATSVSDYELKRPKVIVSQPQVTANFTSPALGFVNEPVTFTNSSVFATSYLWNFGDGDTSTEENPVHTYAANGDYTITLQINGDPTLSASKAITVRTIANETLLGSDMEVADRDIWGITGATTFGVGSAIWGNTAPATFDTGGYLYLEETNGTATQYYIWQAVQLKKDGRYDLSFDYAKGTFLKAWGEVYIGTVLPGGGDYTDGGSRGTNPMSWANTEANTGTFVNGQYSFSYDCTADSVYFFVIKTGTNGNGKFLFGVDNVKLTKIVDPIADFTAPSYGFAGVPVQFTGNSLNANSYSWDFGDGAAASIDENPSHTFATAGAYTVTLTASGASGTSVSTSKQIKIYPIQSEAITGSMDAVDRDNWIEIGAKNITNEGNDKLIWGYDGSHNVEGFAPAENFFGDGGFLTVCEGWGDADIYKIVQAVSLTAGKTYDISLDYALGWYNRTRGEVYVGTEVPSTSLYTDNLVETFLPYAENNPSGNTTLQQLATQFVCTATGVYYFVIQWETGIGGSAGFRSAIDNVKLKVVTTGLSPVENSTTVFANGGRLYVKSAVSSNNIDVYGALGQLVISAKINSDYYESKVLTPGLYIVSVNGKAFKTIVK
jgi:PKD repeat protein